MALKIQVRIHTHVFFFFSFFFRATPVAYRGSQARDQIGAAIGAHTTTTANTGSKPHLLPTPQLSIYIWKRSTSPEYAPLIKMQNISSFHHYHININDQITV